MRSVILSHPAHWFSLMSDSHTYASKCLAVLKDVRNRRFDAFLTPATVLSCAPCLNGEKNPSDTCSHFFRSSRSDVLNCFGCCNLSGKYLSSALANCLTRTQKNGVCRTGFIWNMALRLVTRVWRQKTC